MNTFAEKRTTGGRRCLWRRSPFSLREREEAKSDERTRYAAVRTGDYRAVADGLVRSAKASCDIDAPGLNYKAGDSF